MHVLEVIKRIILLSMIVSFIVADLSTVVDYLIK